MILVYFKKFATGYTVNRLQKEGKLASRPCKACFSGTKSYLFCWCEVEIIDAIT